MRWIRDAIFLVVLMTFVASGMAQAGVTTVQAFNFGEWLSYNNDAEYEITVNTSGGYTYDPEGFVMITAPQEGIYDIDGLTPNAAVSSVVAIQILALTYSTGTFQMDVFQDSHGSNVDGSGVLRVWIGATANTTGNSVSYNDGTYSGTVQIQVNY
ncbi:MAG: DUF4402 domain-containing protein [Alphaproteobacteria bacterium]|nr:DUF4402 domain-containing protein [Alphaproteobacteria bacterium]